MAVLKDCKKDTRKESWKWWVSSLTREKTAEKTANGNPRKESPPNCLDIVKYENQIFSGQSLDCSYPHSQQTFPLFNSLHCFRDIWRLVFFDAEIRPLSGSSSYEAVFLHSQNILLLGSSLLTVLTMCHVRAALTLPYIKTAPSPRDNMLRLPRENNTLALTRC